MLKDNLIMLRGIHGYSQEEIAEQIHISRQAYAKWESGATIPDIEKCSRIAEIYRVTLDSLIRESASSETVPMPPAPKGKNIWGTSVINDRGQVVIPKDAREKFGLSAGTRLIVLSNETGIALIPAEMFEENIRRIMETAFTKIDSE